MEKLLGHRRSQEHKWANFAPLVLRVAVGAIFVVHGYQKAAGLEQLSVSLGSLGIPTPGIVAILVMFVELFGGIALILGMYFRWATKLLTADMLFAALLVYIKSGFFVSGGIMEFTLLLLAATVSLMIGEAGKWSLDKKLLGR